MACFFIDGLTTLTEEFFMALRGAPHSMKMSPLHWRGVGVGRSERRTHP
jgi:hypothetical protein